MATCCRAPRTGAVLAPILSPQPTLSPALSAHMVPVLQVTSSAAIPLDLVRPTGVFWLESV